MKKIKSLVVGIVLTAICSTGLFAQSKGGQMPKLVQAGFYTPSYQCIYLKGTDELNLKFTPNEWNTYELKIDKDSVTYDGMNGDRKNYSMLRVKSNTEKGSTPLVIYVDNITLKDAKGKVVFSVDFENGDPSGAYFSQGKPGENNGTVVTKDGRKCFLINMTTQNLYGYDGVEVQWNLPKNKGKNWDFSNGKYTVSYDYFIEVAQ